MDQRRSQGSLRIGAARAVTPIRQSGQPTTRTPPTTTAPIQTPRLAPRPLIAVATQEVARRATAEDLAAVTEWPKGAEDWWEELKDYLDTQIEFAREIGLTDFDTAGGGGIVALVEVRERMNEIEQS